MGSFKTTVSLGIGTLISNGEVPSENCYTDPKDVYLSLSRARMVKRKLFKNILPLKTVEIHPFESEIDYLNRDLAWFLSGHFNIIQTCTMKSMIINRSVVEFALLRTVMVWHTTDSEAIALLPHHTLRHSCLTTLCGRWAKFRTGARPSEPSAGPRDPSRLRFCHIFNLSALHSHRDWQALASRRMHSWASGGAV